MRYTQLNDILGSTATAREGRKDEQRHDACLLSPKHVAELGPDDDAGWVNYHQS